MRTKTLLLSAAVMAAGLLASRADNVYSVNVVGYAQVVAPLGYTLVANPFTTGSSNGANEVFQSLPDGTTILTWNGAGFSGYYYDTSIGISANNWYELDQSTPSSIPVLPPGQAFFVSPGLAMTNTFAGTVEPAIGQTNHLALPLGYSLVGSVLPVSGALTNASFNLPLPDGTTILQWNGAGYTGFYYDTSIGISPNNWYQLDQTTPSSVPSVDVGQGFFISPGLATDWAQTLSGN